MASTVRGRKVSGVGYNNPCGQERRAARDFHGTIRQRSLSMNFDLAFTLELLLVAALIIAVAAAALYVLFRNRRIQRETGREVGSAGVPVGLGPDDPEDGGEASPRQAPRREFYKSMGLETTEEMKIRLYSVAEYRDELGGTVRKDDFRAALKAYRQIDDEWYDYNPHKAADALELPSEDYEVDEERSALLLRQLPPGLPPAARDVL